MPAFALLVIAQAQTPDPISGGAGWVGAGLLGAVLGWLLFFHLPSKDKQLKEFIDGKDAQLAAKDAHVERMAAKFDESLKELQEFFREQAELNRRFVGEQLDKMARTMTRT